MTTPAGPALHDDDLLREFHSRALPWEERLASRQISPWDLIARELVEAGGGLWRGSLPPQCTKSFQFLGFLEPVGGTVLWPMSTV